MNRRTSNRLGLLSRVSSIAIIAAAGSFGAAQQAEAACPPNSNWSVPSDGTTITTSCNSVTVDSDVSGNVTVNGGVNIGPGGGEGSGIPFDIYNDITGTLTNNGSIFGGYIDSETSGGAVNITNGATLGSLVNNHSIQSDNGNAVQIGDYYGTQGFISNGIFNYDSITSGNNAGIAALAGTFAGGLHNGSAFDPIATINGGLAGVMIGGFGGEGAGADWSGGIENYGQITGGEAGILMGYGGNSGQVNFAGGIQNRSNAEISSTGGIGIEITNDVGSFTDGITNSGTIKGPHGGIRIESTSFSGGLLNDFGGTIEGGVPGSGGGGEGGEGGGSGILADAIYADTLWAGDFTNYGTITGTDDAFEFEGYNVGGEGVDFVGDILNAGTMTGGNTGTAIEIDAETFRGNITNTGTLSGGWAGANIDVYDLAGAVPGTNAQIENKGSISGGYYGFRLNGETVYADFANTQSDDFNPIPAQITSENGAAVVLGAWQWFGDVSNNGTISGDSVGMLIGADITSWGEIWDNYEGLFEGQITNTGSISGDVGLMVLSQNVDGGFENSGTISGNYVGAVFNGVESDNFFYRKGTFTGSITNTSTGVITGGSTGLYIEYDTFDGNFSNAGSIGSEGAYRGVSINVNSWLGDITNEAGGTITGGTTGLRVYVNGNLEGNVTNHGTISAGGGFEAGFVPEFDPGMAVVVSSMTGIITNTGTLDASSNALLVDIGTLTGSVHNTGSIIATTPGNTAVLLDVGNGTTFFNDGGGTIDGDVQFLGSGAYTYAAGAGGIAGSLYGAGSTGGEGGLPDVITVANGEHYFIDGGGEGLSGAYNFTSFTVNNGGVAVMGATAVNSTGGTGYSFSNVGNLTVNSGGEFYIDDQSDLSITGNYVQTGTLSYYLAAPGGSGFSSLTGVQVAAPTDYGSLTIAGTANLSGTLAGYLDPNFINANSGLTEVQYNDVLVASGGITGNFDVDATIANGSLFQVQSLLDGNTIDLRLTRTSVAHLPDVGGIVVETAGPWKSMVNDRSTGIGSGSCGLAGAAGGWCFNQFAQNEPGASSVMTDASEPDPFAWLRTGVRRVGETAVWGRAVGVWGDTSGDANATGTEFDLVGGIVGIDHVFTPIFMAGVAGQWTTTDIDFDGLPDNAEIDSLELGGYFSYGDTRFYLNGNASFIWHEIGVTRFDPTGTARGDYDGTTFSAYAEIGKIFETYDGWRIQPLVALSYAALDTDAYSETGTSASKLNVFDSEFDSLKSMIGARFAYPIELDSGRKMVPEARAVWAHEFLDNQSSYFATIQGIPGPPALIVGQEYSRDYLILGAGFTAPLSEATSFFIDYDAGLNEDITTHTLSGGFRTKW